jgi:hypothetical protein
MDADLDQRQAVEWIVVEDEDWSGVNDCGAIFAPDREMKFEVDDGEWPMQSRC